MRRALLWLLLMAATPLAGWAQSPLPHSAPVPPRQLSGNRLQLYDCSLEAPSSDWRWLRAAAPPVDCDEAYYCVQPDTHSVLVVALSHRRYSQLSEPDLRRSIHATAGAFSRHGLKLEEVQVGASSRPFAANSYRYTLTVTAPGLASGLHAAGYYGAAPRLAVHLLGLLAAEADLGAFDRFVASFETTTPLREPRPWGALTAYLCLGLLVWFGAAVYNQGLQIPVNAPLLALLANFGLLLLRVLVLSRRAYEPAFLASDVRREVLWAICPLLLLGVLAYLFAEQQE